MRRLREGTLSESKRSGELKRVGAAINQVNALLRNGKIDSAIETIEAALGEQKGNPDLMFMRGRCYLAKSDGRSLGVARRAFKKAYELGQRKDLLFSIWYDSEMEAKHPSGAVEVADLALSTDGAQQCDWLKRRAKARYEQAKGFQESRNKETALAEMVACADDLRQAISSCDDPTEQPAVREWWECVNDETWALVSNDGGDIPNIRYAFGLTRDFILKGDRRLANYDRTMTSCERLLRRIHDPLSEGLRNMVSQMVREGGELLGGMGASDLKEYRGLYEKRWRNIDKTMLELVAE